MIQIVENIKKVFGSAGKLALALFVAGIGLLAVIEAYSAIHNFYAKKALQGYAIAMPWAYDLSGQLGLKAKGKRKYIDGALVVTIEFAGSPQFLSDPILRRKNIREERGFQLSFLDADGFSIVQMFTPLSSLATAKGDDGIPIKLSGQQSEFIDLEQYKRISSVKVSWTIDTEIPKAVTQKSRAAPSSDDSTVGDHCAPGISRAVRLKRLAQRGNVRLTGGNTYEAGGKTVMFGYDGGVVYCY
jgi:hypothetical protein